MVILNKIIYNGNPKEIIKTAIFNEQDITNIDQRDGYCVINFKDKTGVTVSETLEEIIDKLTPKTINFGDFGGTR